MVKICPAKLHGKLLYVICHETCFLLTHQGVMVENALSCSHEEADTRILVHANHINNTNNYESIIVTSEDTDVRILLIAFSDMIQMPMFQKCGTAASIH